MIHFLSLIFFSQMIPLSFVGLLRIIFDIWDAFCFFEAVSGLKISLAKSKLVLVGDVPTVNALALILGCRISSFPLNVWAYLWGAPFKAKHIWDIIID